MQRHRQGVGSSENLRNSARGEVSSARRRGRRGGGNRFSPGLVLISVVVFSCTLCLLLAWLSLSPTKSGLGRGSAVTSTATASVFQGTSRTANMGGDKLRIAIVSNAVAFPYSSATTALWSLFKEYFANKDCYAKTHGYDLIIDSRYSSTWGGAFVSFVAPKVEGERNMIPPAGKQQPAPSTSV